jgi:ABC-2 type transport system permease protein
MIRAVVARHIVEHEFRLLVRSRAAVVTLAALLLVVTYAAYNGTRWVREQRDTLDRVSEHDERTYAGIAEQLDELARLGDPRPDLQLAGMAWYIFQPNGAAAPAPHLDPRRAEAAASEWVGARHATLPTAPLAALAVGQSDLHPYYSRITIRTRPVLVNSDEIENPVNLLSGRFDLAFVLTFCWPLLVLPLLYNVISEDRESGTLALVASQPVSFHAVVAARVLVRGGAVAALTIVASVGALAAFGGLPAGASAGLVTWAGAIVATTVFWCGLAATVNLARWRSATNATGLTACWLGAVVVLPALVGEAAAVWAPVPSRVQLINEVRAAGSLRSGELAALVNAYYEDHPEAVPSGASADLTAIRGLALQDEIDRRLEPLLLAYREAAARQQRLVDMVLWASPPLLIHEAITELAGTATRRYRRFAGQIDEYQRAWRAYFYPLVHARVSLTQAHYDAAPRFTFQDEALGAPGRRAALLIAVTGGVGVVLLALALACLRRSPVTTVG